MLIACAFATACSDKTPTDGQVTRSAQPLGDGGDDADAGVCFWYLPDGGVWFTCPEHQTCPHPDGCNHCSCNPPGLPPSQPCTLIGCPARDAQ